MNQTQIRREAATKESQIIEWEKYPDYLLLKNEPVENLHHQLLASALREVLEIEGLITSKVLVGANLGICVTVNGRYVLKAPDWFYIPNVLPVEPGEIRRTYTPNLEGEIPAMVMEFISDRDQGEYSIRLSYPYGKFYFYEKILQVPVYAIFEPNGAILEVRNLVDGEYKLQERDSNGLFWIEALELYLGVWYGTKAGETRFWLRWWDESNRMLLWAVERMEASRKEARG